MRGFLAVVAAASVGACATQRATQAEAAPAAAQSQTVVVAEGPSERWETWPPPEAAAMRQAPAPSEAMVRLEPKAGGWSLLDLTDLVAKTTQRSIVFDSANQVMKAGKLEFVNAFEVPESALFDWYRAALASRKLGIVPLGPPHANGGTGWLVLDMADPSLRTRPTWIDESEVYANEDKDGFLVATAIRLRDTVDPARVRISMSQFVTAWAGIGRLQDTGRFLVVADFAPIVATIKRAVDRINLETPPSAAMKPLTPPAAPAK
jgi:hypothetical protein